ncbi:hypothetical protein BAUCODRAFT_149001 [Baudoinia panamericana UAMH 10762]|uniref:MYND-type domain-containing protein n=1 Tax=Baudoinia panamericana (strain UAMH 10762) TaxID=717646 RepID=M2N835_BAUPA|nr:uncharacterized protein BAUCODRAFT_149001 [Baudoinia panamericana UAMH 10762]EMC94960.1 hypothetical protein BAUCODRAFT_149001 [Baudoinia panamericana UAMH 10762]
MREHVERSPSPSREQVMLPFLESFDQSMSWDKKRIEIARQTLCNPSSWMTKFWDVTPRKRSKKEKCPDCKRRKCYCSSTSSEPPAKRAKKEHKKYTHAQEGAEDCAETVAEPENDLQVARKLLDLQCNDPSARRSLKTVAETDSPPKPRRIRLLPPKPPKADGSVRCGSCRKFLGLGDHVNDEFAAAICFCDCGEGVYCGTRCLSRHKQSHHGFGEAAENNQASKRNGSMTTTCAQCEAALPEDTYDFDTDEELIFECNVCETARLCSDECLALHFSMCDSPAKGPSARAKGKMRARSRSPEKENEEDEQDDCWRRCYHCLAPLPEEHAKGDDDEPVECQVCDDVICCSDSCLDEHWGDEHPDATISPPRTACSRCLARPLGPNRLQRCTCGKRLYCDAECLQLDWDERLHRCTDKKHCNRCGVSQAEDGGPLKSCPCDQKFYCSKTCLVSDRKYSVHSCELSESDKSSRAGLKSYEPDTSAGAAIIGHRFLDNRTLEYQVIRPDQPTITVRATTLQGQSWTDKMRSYWTHPESMKLKRKVMEHPLDYDREPGPIGRFVQSAAIFAYRELLCNVREFSAGGQDERRAESLGPE